MRKENVKSKQNVDLRGKHDACTDDKLMFIFKGLGSRPVCKNYRQFYDKVCFWLLFSWIGLLSDGLLYLL